MRGKGRPWNDTLYLVAAMLCTAAISAVVWLLFRAGREPGYFHRGVYEGTYALAVGILSGVVVAVPVTSYWAARGEPEAHGGGILGRRSFVAVFLTMAALHAIGGWLSYDHFIQVDGSVVRLSGWWEFETRSVPVADLERAIVFNRARAPNGKTVHRPHLVLETSNGGRINTHYLLHDRYHNLLKVLGKVRQDLKVVHRDIDPIGL
jgi:hypothetical protein